MRKSRRKNPENGYVNEKLQRGGRSRKSWADNYARQVASGRSLGEVAKEFGVSRAAVFYACQRRGVKSIHRGGGLK